MDGDAEAQKSMSELLQCNSKLYNTLVDGDCIFDFFLTTVCTSNSSHKKDDPSHIPGLARQLLDFLTEYIDAMYVQPTMDMLATHMETLKTTHPWLESDALNLLTSVVRRLCIFRLASLHEAVEAWKAMGFEQVDDLESRYYEFFWRRVFDTQDHRHSELVCGDVQKKIAEAQ